MTDEQSADRPLALGALAETASLEIVRTALSRFRRRLLIRGLVVVLAVGAAFALCPRYFGKPKELTQEIRDARGIELAQTIEVDAIHGSVLKVARLSNEGYFQPRERFGILLAATTDALTPSEQIVVALFPDQGNGVLEVQTATGKPNISGVQVWISVVPGERVIDVPFAGVARNGSGLTVVHPSLGTLHLDMEELKVPDRIWR